MQELFNNSLFAYLFPNLDTPEGQALLADVITYVEQCYGYIEKDCPKLWECFALNYIAYILSTWGISIDEEGSEPTDPSSCDSDMVEPHLYLKRRTTGGVTCEYAEFKPDCVDCSDKNLSQWKGKWMDALETCNKSKGAFVFGGTCFPEQKHDNCCNTHEIKRKTCC